MIKQFIKPFFILVLLANASFAQQSRYMPVPPPDNDRGRVNLPQLFGTNATGDVVVSSVPAYLWQHGCGPTALGMVVGYYDGKGFSDLVPGNAATQTTDVDNVIANTQHYDDYSLPIDYYPNLYADKSQNGGAHTSNCLADFMETSWSSRDNFYGWSWSNDIANSFNRYIPFINPDYQCQTGYKWYSNSDSWSFYKNEIDNNRPVVLLVDSDGNGGTDHFVTGIGYNSTSNTYAIYDTWDRSVHWYSWHAMTNGNAWGIYGYTYFRLKFSVTASTDPTNMGSVQGGGYYFTGEQVTLIATANEDYRFVNWN